MYNIKSGLSGFLAASYTPLDEKEDLNLDMVSNYYDHLKANSIKGILINGSTGDFASLTIEERNAMVKKWCDIVDRDFYTINHVGHTSLRECQRMAEYSGACGVDAIVALPPFYYKPDIESVIDFCAEVAKVNPYLPFFYYHIPELTGVDFKMEVFLDMAKDKIPNLAGIKFTKEDMTNFKMTINYDPERFDIMFGVDEIMIESLAMGATGWIGSTYNHISSIYRGIKSAFDKNDQKEARRLQDISMDFVKTTAKYGWPAASKYALKLLGLDLGPVRLPHKNLTGEQMSSYEEELNRIGFFDQSKLLQAI